MGKENIAELKLWLFRLLKKYAYKEGRVILASGKEADYYLDARLVTLSSEGAYLTAKIILDIIRNDVLFDFGKGICAIGGPTLGADPFLGAIAAISFLDDKPLNTFIIRKAPKEHGMCRRIEGPLLTKGDNVVVVDDVATSGKSVIEAVSVLRQEGVNVKGAITIVDRQEGACSNLAKINCPFISIFKASEFK